MAAVNEFQRQLIEYTRSLYDEGYLDGQFTQLHKLQDELDIVVEVVSPYFEESENLFNYLATTLQQKTIDYKEVKARLHKYEGTCSSIGVQRVANVCDHLKNYCEEKNLDGCLRCLQQVKHEFNLVRNKLEALFTLEQKVLQAGGSVPPIE